MQTYHILYNISVHDELASSSSAVVREVLLWVLGHCPPRRCTYLRKSTAGLASTAMCMVRTASRGLARVMPANRDGRISAGLSVAKGRDKQAFARLGCVQDPTEIVPASG